MLTILLVDDNPNNLQSYLYSLEMGFPDANILKAIDEEQAFDQIHNNENIDVIISDLRMEHENSGLIILKEAKKYDPLAMVILITAFDEPTDRIQAFQLGVFDFLVKGSVGVKTANELIYKSKSAIYTKNVIKELSQEKQRIEVFRKYHDPYIFEKMKSDPGLLNPQNRIVTIVFWDIRNFSAFSEKLKANTEIVAGFLTDYYERTSKIIFKHRGVLDKFIGDGILALFGPFTSNENDYKQCAIDAINCALEMRNEFDVLVSKWRLQWQMVCADTIDIGLGCGIHTGEVLVGSIGTELRDHFTAIGAHVNLASRIESSSKNGEIRISATTVARVAGSFNFKKIDTLSNIKNIYGSFNIFTLA